MTDDDRKVLDGYMGHIRIKPHHGSCCTCQRCGQFHDACWCTEYDTIEDLHAVYSKMVDRKEWEEFQNHMVYKYREVEKDDYTRWFVAAFEKWLFCLACPEQLPERMKLAAGWIRAKG